MLIIKVVAQESKAHEQILLIGSSAVAFGPVSELEAKFSDFMVQHLLKGIHEFRKENSLPEFKATLYES